jgi:UDP-glucose:(heptosyl)LPS alpha-1,3-glucosyltransferase
MWLADPADAGDYLIYAGIELTVHFPSVQTLTILLSSPNVSLTPNRRTARMKLALIRAKYDPFGGAERFLNSAADALVAQDASPTIITRAWPQSANAAISHKIVNPHYFTSAGRDRGFARAACALLQTEKFDLVQSYERLACCDVFHAVDGVHAEWLVQRKRVQSAIKQFGVRINPHHRYVLDAERAMYHSSKLRAVICISQMVKQDVLRHYDIAPEKLHVIYGSVDTEAFHPRLRDEHRLALRKQLGIEPNAPVAIYVGSGFERKGVAGFLTSVAKVAGLHGIVVGRDKRMAHYRAFADSLGLAQRVIFTGGISDVRPYYGASDVFVMPTLYEPFGLVFGEAMACGLPAVASTQSGAADWITHGVDGFVVDALDAAAIAQSIEAALADPAMGMRAREKVLPYTGAATGAQYAALYRQLLAR